MNIHWQAVFFDFDGVIAQSVEVKTAAFRTLFKGYGEKICSQIVQYHLENGGMPRSVKIRYYLTELLGQQPDEQETARLEKHFSDLVVDGVIQAPLMPGVLDTLTKLQALRIPAFVVSGTPHEEMNLVVEQKGLSQFFQEIHGSPRPKHTIVMDILKRLHLVPERCLFIGDAMADYRAAERAGTCFLGIVHAQAPVLFPKGTPLSETVTLNLP